MTRKMSRPAPALTGKAPAQILVEVEFGMPSRQCVNYGICRIEVARAGSHPENSSRCGECGALALASSPGTALLELAFLRSSLPRPIRELHFGKPYFRVDEDYTLPGKLCENLGLQAAAVGCGLYSIQKSHSWFVIKFRNLISS